MTKRWVVVVLCVLAAPASAQSINVNFGDPAHAPSSSYAAAGAAGTWNSVSGISGMTFSVVAIDGSATPIMLTQSPTTTLLAVSDPSVSGDDATLLNSGLVTTDAETCLAFTGFQPGDYEVLVYAWMPDQPGVKSRTRQDEAPSTVDVGGAWTGAHVEGVTYARYVVTVDASGALPAHSGLVPGQPSAALNGIQIRPLDTGGGVDAGGGGGGTPGDAGSDLSPHHGGCSTGGSTGIGMLLVALGFAYRRRR
jgi:hypothetical protein